MPQKPYRITITVPAELRPLIRERMREEAIPSESKYHLSLLLFDLFSRCQHTITAQVVNGPDDLFYRIVDEIVREFPEARQKVSDWLKHRLADIIAEDERAQAKKKP